MHHFPAYLSGQARARVTPPPEMSHPQQTAQQQQQQQQQAPPPAGYPGAAHGSPTQQPYGAAATYGTAPVSSAPYGALPPATQGYYAAQPIAPPPPGYATPYQQAGPPPQQMYPPQAPYAPAQQGYLAPTAPPGYFQQAGQAAAPPQTHYSPPQYGAQIGAAPPNAPDGYSPYGYAGAQAAPSYASGQSVAYTGYSASAAHTAYPYGSWGPSASASPSLPPASVPSAMQPAYVPTSMATSAYGAASAPPLSIAGPQTDSYGLPVVSGDVAVSGSRPVQLSVEEKVMDATGDSFYVREGRRTRYTVDGSRTQDQYKCMKDSRGQPLLQLRHTSTFKSKMVIQDMAGNVLLTLVKQNASGGQKKVHGYLGMATDGRAAVVIVGNANSQMFHIENEREAVVAKLRRSIHSFKRRFTGQDSYSVEVLAGSAALAAMLTVAIDEMFCDAND